MCAPGWCGCGDFSEARPSEAVRLDACGEAMSLLGPDLPDVDLEDASSARENAVAVWLVWLVWLVLWLVS
jgi:hypothetical protein